MVNRNLTGTGISSKYTGVFYIWSGSLKKSHWNMQCEHKGRRAQKIFEFTDEGERKAAIAYDKARLINGLEPVNILKKRFTI